MLSTQYGAVHERECPFAIDEILLDIDDRRLSEGVVDTQDPRRSQADRKAVDEEIGIAENKTEHDHRDG